MTDHLAQQDQLLLEAVRCLEAKQTPLAAGGGREQTMTESIESALAAEEVAARTLRAEAQKIGERLQHLSAVRRRLTAGECEELQRLRVSLAEAQGKLAETVATIEAWTRYGDDGGSQPVLNRQSQAGAAGR